MLTQVELSTVRAYVGDEPDDDALDALYDLHGSPEAVAHVVLSGRLSALRDGPTKFSVDGDVTEDYTANLSALERQIATLDARLGLGATKITTGRLYRPTRR